MIVQCQEVSPENIHMSNTIQTEPVILRNIYVCTYTYMYAITVSEKEVVNLKEIKEEYGGLERGKGRNKCYIIIKKKAEP